MPLHSSSDSARHTKFSCEVSKRLRPRSLLFSHRLVKTIMTTMNATVRIISTFTSEPYIDRFESVHEQSFCLDTYLKR